MNRNAIQELKGCTLVCTALLLQFISLKYSCNILIPINNTVNFYILTIYFINNYIIFFSSSKSFSNCKI